MRIRLFRSSNRHFSFSNPQIPYKWEHLDGIREGVYCVFNAQFFHQFGQFKEYEVFQPNGNHVFELTDEQAEQVSSMYDKNTDGV